jgi:hypothetical protein
MLNGAQRVQTLHSLVSSSGINLIRDPLFLYRLIRTANQALLLLVGFVNLTPSDDDPFRIR